MSDDCLKSAAGEPIAVDCRGRQELLVVRLRALEDAAVLRRLAQGHGVLARSNARPPRTEKVWFCACKRSAKPPLCDGSHKTVARRAPAEPSRGWGGFERWRDDRRSMLPRRTVGRCTVSNRSTPAKFARLGLRDKRHDVERSHRKHVRRLSNIAARISAVKHDRTHTVVRISPAGRHVECIELDGSGQRHRCRGVWTRSMRTLWLRDAEPIASSDSGITTSTRSMASCTDAAFARRPLQPLPTRGATE